MTQTEHVCTGRHCNALPELQSSLIPDDLAQIWLIDSLEGDAYSPGFLVDFLDNALGTVMGTSQHEDGAIEGKQLPHLRELGDAGKE